MLVVRSSVAIGLAFTPRSGDQRIAKSSSIRSNSIPIGSGLLLARRWEPTKSSEARWDQGERDYLEQSGLNGLLLRDVARCGGTKGHCCWRHVVELEATGGTPEVRWQGLRDSHSEKFRSGHHFHCRTLDTYAVRRDDNSPERIPIGRLRRRSRLRRRGRHRRGRSSWRTLCAVLGTSKSAQRQAHHEREPHRCLPSPRTVPER